MKKPKLKYYYYALNQANYEEFERTRIVQPRPLLYFYSTAGVADTRYRQLNHHTHSVFVLRIPREYVPRDLLVTGPDALGMWILAEPILLPHCAVERFELDTSVPVPVEMVVVATNKPIKIVIPQE